MRRDGVAAASLNPNLDHSVETSANTQQLFFLLLRKSTVSENPASVRLWSPYDPLGGAAVAKPLCSSSAITDMCLNSAGWWLKVSTNRYVSCLCVP